MPKVRPLLPNERIRDAFYKKLKIKGIEMDLDRDYKIAARLGINKELYSYRKSKRTLSAWSADDLAEAFIKFRFTPEDIADVYMEGMSV